MEHEPPKEEIMFYKGKWPSLKIFEIGGEFAYIGFELDKVVLDPDHQANLVWKDAHYQWSNQAYADDKGFLKKNWPIIVSAGTLGLVAVVLLVFITKFEVVRGTAEALNNAADKIYSARCQSPSIGLTPPAA